MPNPVVHPPSPCTNQCALDRGTQVCTGCFRTLDEIATWSTMTAERKLEVIDAISARRAVREEPNGKHSG